MKTAISVPNEIFQRAERLAKRSHRSRSELYSAALKEYVARHTPEEVTEAMNRACDATGEGRNEFVSAAARQVLERVEW